VAPSTFAFCPLLCAPFLLVIHTTVEQIAFQTSFSDLVTFRVRGRAAGQVTREKS
jgi:hypothetical protein